MREFVLLSAHTLFLTVLIVSSLNIGWAQVMSSPSYQMQSDSVNIGGGNSGSGNYLLESTAGEIATGESASDSFRIFAGFQQMQGSYISLSSTGDVALSAIQGVSGGFSTGSTTMTVITDNVAGYQLTIEAEGDPAMQSETDSIADYVPVASPDPDFTFTTDASDSHFGFSPEGADLVQRYLDATGLCNQSGGSDTNDACWDGLSTTPRTIATGSGSNHPTGADTVIEFQVGIGGSVNQTVGSYTATTTVTAIAI